MSKLLRLIIFGLGFTSLGFELSEESLVNNFQSENLPSFNEQSMSKNEALEGHCSSNEQLMSKNEALKKQIRSLSEPRESEQFNNWAMFGIGLATGILVGGAIVGGINYHFYDVHHVNILSELKSIQINGATEIKYLEDELINVQQLLIRSDANLRDSIARRIRILENEDQ